MNLNTYERYINATNELHKALAANKELKDQQADIKLELQTLWATNGDLNRELLTVNSVVEGQFEENKRTKLERDEYKKQLDVVVKDRDYAEKALKTALEVERTYDKAYAALWDDFSEVEYQVKTLNADKVKLETIKAELITTIGKLHARLYASEDKRVRDAEDRRQWELAVNSLKASHTEFVKQLAVSDTTITILEEEKAKLIDECDKIKKNAEGLPPASLAKIWKILVGAEWRLGHYMPFYDKNNTWGKYSSLCDCDCDAMDVEYDTIFMDELRDLIKSMPDPNKLTII